MGPDRSVVEAEAVCVDYRSLDGTVPAVVQVSLSLPDGSLTVLAGPSGSGKSSLLRVLGLIDRPTSGAVRIVGRDVLALSDRRRRDLRRTTLAYVHQRPITNLVDSLTAAQQVTFVRELRGMPRADASVLLERFGLGSKAGSHPAQLSGGEQQRLAIAMATAAEPTVLYADEPTAELDRRHADDVIEALHRSTANGRAVVVASHDPELIAAATNVVWLREGRRVNTDD